MLNSPLGFLVNYLVSRIQELIKLKVCKQEQVHGNWKNAEEISIKRMLPAMGNKNPTTLHLSQIPSYPHHPYEPTATEDK